jgi:hypothetical protein
VYDAWLAGRKDTYYTLERAQRKREKRTANICLGGLALRETVQTSYPGALPAFEGLHVTLAIQRTYNIITFVKNRCNHYRFSSLKYVMILIKLTLNA